MTAKTDVERALALDQNDALAVWKPQFAQPEDRHGRSSIYFCSNSLGLMPKGAREAVRRELAAWEQLGVRGHFKTPQPWVSFHRLAAPHLAALTGALESEVVAMNTLTVNLHLFLVSFYRPTAHRKKILIESDAFPSDRYAVSSQLALHGHDPDEDLVEWRPRPGEHCLRTDDLEELLTHQAEQIALILLPGVQYLTGQALDLQAISELARRHGIALGFDLAHAIGNLPLSLHDWGPDFAVWCSYKYLNGGPGAIGGGFVHERHLESKDLPRLLGWWGHDEATRFKMERRYVAASGADAWQLSTAPILSLAPVIAALEAFHAAGLPLLRKKSIALNEFLDTRLRQTFGDRVAFITPGETAQRGCQLSLIVRDIEAAGPRLVERLAQLNVDIDWRAPDIIRVAPVPFYNSFQEVHEFVERFALALGGI